MRTVLLSFACRGRRTDEIARELREHDPPIVVRVQQERVWIDPRTLFSDDLPVVAAALAQAAGGEGDPV